MIIHSVCAIIKKTEVLNVKMTMITHLAQLLAPDYCSGCHKIGHILCQSCRDDIISEPFGRCLACLEPTSRSHLCVRCRTLADDAWVVGERAGTLQRLVDDSKFASNRRACLAQALLLDQVLPKLPEDTIIVPIPTTTRHVRQRGYGHMELVARSLAERRGYRTDTILRRDSNAVQHGADKSTRQRQAALAFSLRHELPADAPLLVIDDVYTTGATMRSAIKLLRNQTEQPIYVALTTRQILD